VTHAIDDGGALEAERVRVFAICGRRHPFKIVSSIVILITISVVDLETIRAR